MNSAGSSQHDAWLARLIDGPITPDEEAKLQHAAAEDPDLLTDYLDLIDMHAILHYECRDTAQAITSVEGRSPAKRATAQTVAGYFAAVLLLATAVAIYIFFINSDPSQPESLRLESPANRIATLIETTGEGKLTTPHDYPIEGQDYGPGEYTLDAGTAEFMLTNAVNVKLNGATRMVIHNDMKVSLNAGSAEFTVPHEASGFTAYLPGGLRVIDLGTRFRVSVDGQDAIYVHVFVGSVEVVRVDKLGEEVERATVVAGETAVTIGAGQRISREGHLFVDKFEVDTSACYTMTQSHGSGGSYSIDGGAMIVKPGAGNTVTVMRSDRPWLAVGTRLLVDLPVLTGASDQFLNISSGPEEPDVGEGRFGFRVRRQSESPGVVWVQSYASDSVSSGQRKEVEVTTEPITLVVERISKTHFRCLYRRASDPSDAELRLIDDREQPDLSDIPLLYVGVQAWGNVEGAEVRFDNMTIDSMPARGAGANSIDPNK